MVHSQTIETYGRHAWPILLFALVAPFIPLLTTLPRLSIGDNPGGWGVATPDFGVGGRGVSMKYYYTQ